jgi:uncharacterized protein YodC (DUF2158 family)
MSLPGNPVDASARYLQAGEIVRLKSGGPPMTVVLGGVGRVRCQWFDTKNQLLTETFDTKLLVMFE